MPPNVKLRVTEIVSRKHTQPSPQDMMVQAIQDQQSWFKSLIKPRKRPENLVRETPEAVYAQQWGFHY